MNTYNKWPLRGTGELETDSQNRSKVLDDLCVDILHFLSYFWKLKLKLHKKYTNNYNIL